MKRSIWILAATLIVAVAGAAQGATVVVSPSNLNGWTIYATPSEWSATFVNGPATPPAGTGSLNFVETINDGSNEARASLGSLDGQLLSNISTLSYSTYVTQWNGQQAPWIRIYVDTDNNGSTDQYLTFEPDYQFISPSNQNPAATTGTWQTWDTTTNHGWYAQDANTGNYTFAAEGDISTGNLADYVAAHPTYRIATDHAGAGGDFRIRSGLTGPGDNFDTNIDNVTINSTTYDFEAVAPAPLPAAAWMGMSLLGALGVGTMLRSRLTRATA